MAHGNLHKKLKKQAVSGCFRWKIDVFYEIRKIFVWFFFYSRKITVSTRRSSNFNYRRNRNFALFSRLSGDYTSDQTRKQCAVKEQNSPLIIAICRKWNAFPWQQQSSFKPHKIAAEQPAKKCSYKIPNRADARQKKVKQRYVTHL